MNFLKPQDHLEASYSDFMNSQVKSKSIETVLKFPPYTFTEEDYAIKLVPEDTKLEPAIVEKKDIQIF